MLQQNDSQQKAIMDAESKIRAKALERDAGIKGKGLKDYWTDVRFYYLPILILVVFFLIVFLGVYPALSLLLGNIDELDSIRDQVQKKDEKIVILKELETQKDTTNRYLVSINEIAPVEKTNVANFQTAIKNIASQNNLRVIDATSGEEIVANEESATNFLQLIEVPTSFELQGSFQDLRNFLIDIYQGDDFIIIEEMKFRKEEGETDWRMDVIFVKYQFVESETMQTTQLNEYIKISEASRPAQEVLDFLDEKYIKPE